MHILMNLNDFDTIFLCKFYPTIFCSENSEFFLVFLENNNMKRLLMFPLCMIIFVLF